MLKSQNIVHGDLPFKIKKRNQLDQ